MGRIFWLTIIFYLLVVVSSSLNDHGQRNNSCISPASAASINYQSVFSFGDSYNDIGNSHYAFNGQNQAWDHNPYGETFFLRPTGRPSDGRLPIDFIAESLNLPLLQPYLANLTASSYAKGAIFAVYGATAQTTSFFTQRSMTTLTNDNLDVQLGWFFKLLPSLCSTKQACHNLLSTALFVLGEIGENDYTRGFLAEKTLAEIQNYVPDVVHAVTSAARVLLRNGAKHVVVVGQVAIGCKSGFLTFLPSQNPADYDQFGCLKSINSLSAYHNILLLNSVKRLQRRFPQAKIIFSDLYNVAMDVYGSPPSFGITNTLSACCGRGGNYSFSLLPEDFCGQSSVPVCPNPSAYMNWDGLHFTESANKVFAQSIVSAI